MPGTWPRDVSDGAVFRTARALPSARGSSERPRRACSTCGVRVAIAPGRGSPSSCARPTRRPRFVASNCRRRKGSPTSISRVRARSPLHNVVLICGHGTRDTCCAVRGTAVHAALASPPGAGSAVDLVASGRASVRGKRARATGRHPPRPRSCPTPRRTWSPERSPERSTSSTTEGGRRTRRRYRRASARCERPRASTQSRISTSSGLTATGRAFGAETAGSTRPSPPGSTDRPFPRAAGPRPSAGRVHRPARLTDGQTCSRYALVGDPDDHLAQPLGWLADRDERAEHDACPTAGDKRSRRGDAPVPRRLRLEDRQQLWSEAGGRTHRGEGAALVAVLELLRVACFEQLQSERTVRSGARVELPPDLRAVLDPDARAQPFSVTRIDVTVKTICSPGLPYVSRQSSSANWGDAATVGTVSGSSLPRRFAFDARTKPANVAPSAMRTMIEARLTERCSHRARGQSRWRR